MKNRLFVAVLMCLALVACGDDTEGGSAYEPPKNAPSLTDDDIDAVFADVSPLVSSNTCTLDNPPALPNPGHPNNTSYQSAECTKSNVHDNVHTNMTTPDIADYMDALVANGFNCDASRFWYDKQHNNYCYIEINDIEYSFTAIEPYSSPLGNNPYVYRLLWVGQGPS
jgi:hypothetical protein